MTHLSIFYVVFILQILILTVFFPAKLLQRIWFIQKEFPESSHPKLYPQSTNYYKKSSTLFSLLNTLVFILGGVILYYIYEGSLVSEEGINPMLPWGYFMIQMIPMWLLNMFGFRMSKLMKQEDTRTQKSAELAPRGIFNYISPMLLGVVILAYIVFVTFAFYLEGFVFDLGGKAFLMSVILLLGYIFYFIVSASLIYGKKRDPYQSPKDKSMAISMVIKTYCFTMIACAVFMAFALSVSVFDLKSMMPVGMSLFLQIIAIASTGYMLQNCRIEDINFDVYKADPLAGDKL